MDQNCQDSVPTETDYGREVDEMLKWNQEIAERVETDMEGGARNLHRRRAEKLNQMFIQTNKMNEFCPSET